MIIIIIIRLEFWKTEDDRMTEENFYGEQFIIKRNVLKKRREVMLCSENRIKKHIVLHTFGNHNDNNRKF